MNEQFEIVERGTEKYWVSLVGWGFIKRKLYSPKNLNRFRFPSFVPFCEIAVFTNSPSTGKPAIAVIEFQSKIEKMAESMNKFRLGTSSYYTINAVKEGVLANTKVWNTNSSGYGLSARCEITVNQNMMEGFNLSDDTIAWVIGHELGHCELGHNRFKQLFVNKVQQRFINGVT